MIQSGMFNHIEVPSYTPVNMVDTTTELGRVYHIPNGKVYPSITTVLSVNDNEWLIPWREAMGEDAAKRISTEASIRGDTVHKMVERYLNNEDKKDIVINKVGDYKFMFRQLMPLLKKIDNICAQEAPLYSEVLRTAGRVDCIADYDGVLSIIDFKTSSRVKSRSNISNYFKQGAAYSIMWEELTGIKIEQVVILMAVKNNIIPLKFIEPVDKWKDALRADIKKFLNTNHGLGIDL